MSTPDRVGGTRGTAQSSRPSAAPASVSFADYHASWASLATTKTVAPKSTTPSKRDPRKTGGPAVTSDPADAKLNLKAHDRLWFPAVAAGVSPPKPAVTLDGTNDKTLPSGATSSLPPVVSSPPYWTTSPQPRMFQDGVEEEEGDVADLLAFAHGLNPSELDKF
eukprot:m.59154 g.59154  ORF g.59154 m.59154 type:complete len:164 (+) comp7870_c0_seq2:232-723(+)